MHKLLLLVFILITSSCSHYKSKAKNFMKARKWLEARAMWQMHLNSDPDDKEALAGRDKAEFEATNEILVRVRNKREAGNAEGAIQDARMLHDLHKKWKRTLNVNFSSFQKSELRKLLGSYISLIQNSIEANQPLRANFLYKEYYLLFQTLDYKGKVKKFPEVYSKQGRALCNKIKRKGMNYPFYRLFARSVCKHFNVNIKGIKETTSIGIDLISDYMKSLNIKQLSFFESQKFDNQFKAALQKSPWFYHYGKKKLNLEMRGSFGRTKNTWVDTRERETKNDQGKKIKKTIYYKMQKEQIRLSFNTNISLGGKYFDFPYEKKSKQTRDVWSGDNPPDWNDGYGVELYDKAKWLSKRHIEYYNQILTQLTDLYNSFYCNFTKDGTSKEAFGNQLIRCARHENNIAKSEIDFWFKQNYAVTYKELVKVLGKLN